MNIEKSIVSVMLLFFLSVLIASAGKVEIYLAYSDPAPVFAPSTVDLTAPEVTVGSYAIEDGYSAIQSLSFLYFYDEGLTRSISDPAHIDQTGRYYVKAWVRNHEGFLYTASGSVWVSVNSSVCSGELVLLSPSGVAPGFTWDYPVISPDLSINGATAQKTAVNRFEQALVNTTNKTATATYIIKGMQNGISYQFVKIVKVNPNVTIRPFNPSTSIRRQGAETINYTTTSNNSSSSVVYSLDATTQLFAGNRIDSILGNITFSSKWSGITTITASARGCGGPATTTHVVNTYIPSLGLIKTGFFVDNPPTGSVNPGDVISYKFKISNTGTIALSNITITDDLVSVKGLPIPSLAAGAVDSTSFSASYSITQRDINAGKVINQAVVSGTVISGDIVSDLSDNNSNRENDKTVILLEQKPAMLLSKESVEKFYSAVGDKLHYVIKVLNKGNVSIKNLAVLDAGADTGSVVYVSGDENNDKISDPGEVWVYNAIHTVNEADVVAGRYSNTASVTGLPEGGILASGIATTDVIEKQTLAISNGSETEGKNIPFTVSLIYPSVSNISFSPSLISGTANVGADTESFIEYATTPGNTWTKCDKCTITIPSGESRVLLRVPTINDNDEEPDETFSLLVTLTSSNTINSSAIGIGTILDNDAVPKASDDICSVDEDSQLKYNCSSNDLPNGVTNVWAIVKQPQHGNVTMDKNGSFIYTPHANFNGTDSFIYKLCDDDGDCDEATVSILVNSINDFPIANDDVIELKLDVNFDGDVSLNDIPSADGGNLWSLVTPPHDVTIIFSPDGSFTLKPTTEFKGTESFVYQLCDVDGSCDTATVTISTSDIVPNQILTPNSDGKNDTFIIKGIEYYPDNFVAIYNRWGNLVYQKSGYFNEWDGYANVSKIGSNPLPSGTYYFVVDYAKGRHKVGFVFLQRSN